MTFEIATLPLVTSLALCSVLSALGYLALQAVRRAATEPVPVRVTEEPPVVDPRSQGSDRGRNCF